MKRLICYVLLLVSPVICTADLERSKPELVDMSSSKLAEIAPAMAKYVEDGKLAGVITLVARRGKIVHFETEGLLNLETGEALKEDSLFRIYSMSKPIVTAAAMMLYEEGKFQLDDPVARYLPEFTDTLVLVEGKEVKQDHPFTVRELMSHSAGLTYGIFGNTPVDQRYRKAKIMQQQNLEEMVQELGKMPLLYQPGTRWVYSVSADVLGRFIEVIADQPLDAFLDERLFTPLGMDDTFFQVPEDKISRFGTNHRANRTTGELSVSDDPAKSRYARKVTLFSGGGGLVSSTMDYLRFTQMMLNDGELNGVRVLKPDTVKQMTQNQLKLISASGSGELTTARKNFGFGLGFGVSTVEPTNGLGSKGEYQWGGAAGTIFWNDPREDLTAILMVQISGARLPLRGDFRKLVYGAIMDGAGVGTGVSAGDE